MPAFKKHESNSWISCPEAQGPFQGLHGGALAGLMISELEQMAAQLDLGLAVSASVEFLRPTRSGVLRTDPCIVRQGRRTSFLSNHVQVGKDCTAQASVCFVHPIAMHCIEQPQITLHNPSSLLKLPSLKSIHGGPWMMDNFEVRKSDKGIIWFRYTDEIVDGMTPMARVLGAADWTHGLDRPNKPRLADPNINLNVVLARHPSGDHIGIQPDTTWTPNGIGMGDGRLLDEYGPFGRVTMSVVLTELE